MANIQKRDNERIKMLVTLEHLRGVVASVKPGTLPVIDLVFNGGGYELGCSGQFVKGARGSRRVFATADAALRYVRRNLCMHLGRDVSVHCQVGAGLL